MTQTKRLPDGYTGQTVLFAVEPVERDGHLVKLRCAEPGKAYMTAWKRAEDLWTKLPAAAKGSNWEHASGWKVLHCGHPTANWPYYLEHQQRPGIVVSFNGRGFKSAEIARSVVERIVLGEIKITTKNCASGISCTANTTAYGEAVTATHATVAIEGVKYPATILRKEPKS
jgi:hypothetical protein